MVAKPAHRRATYEDVLAAPPGKVAEVVDGELYLNARPAQPDTAAHSALLEELGPPFKRGRGGPGGWLTYLQPELHLGEDVFVPDLGGWRRERLPHLGRNAYFDLAPDWLAEVLSDSTRKLDRAKKLPRYARAGVKHVWLVDPILRTLEVLRLSGDVYSIVGTHADDEKVRGEPFDAIELDLSILWADVVL